MQGLDGDAALLLYPDPCCDALWLCNKVQTINDPVSHTDIFLQLFSVAAILKFHTCNPKNLTDSSPC